MSENERIAKALREGFAAQGACCLNFVGSQKSGKTSLVERTLSIFPLDARIAILMGPSTGGDFQRLERYGFPVRQVGTAGACHLDARMVERALEGWHVPMLDYLFIDNVGNLVCPSRYDLGEQDKIVVFSVTEGEDTPLKYQDTFSQAGLVILNKIDLLPGLSFDKSRTKQNISKINTEVGIIEVSCATGAGLGDWYQWVEDRRRCENSPTRPWPDPGFPSPWGPN